MLVTLPFVMLLLDYWPLNRVAGSGIRFSSLLFEKIPFFLLALASSVMTVLAQRAAAMVALHEFPFSLRLANAVVAYWSYLLKTFWPVNLAALYPARLEPDWIQVAAAAATLAGISALVVREAAKRRWLLVGWLWFLGTLVPVIGLVQVGSQAMADRYTYVPLIGVFVIVAFGAGELAGRFRVSRPRLALAAGLVLVACLAATAAQLRHWRDSESLFRRALAVTKNNAPAHAGLGDALARQGRDEEALAEFLEALRLAPASMNAHNDLANVLSRLGRHQEALDHYRTALRLEPDLPLLHCNLGLLLVKLGRIDEACAEYAEAARLDPRDPRPFCFTGKARLKQGLGAEAIASFREALQRDANDAETLTALARVLASDPEARLRNGADAVALAERALAVSGAEIPVLDALAMAYAETGRFKEAEETATFALNLARAGAGKAQVAELEERLKRYQSAQPYRAVR
jgi:tetratricopeptide (TPR) repeat protein